jgi:site-specific DNA-methyltransferase (adenine-specific)
MIELLNENCLIGMKKLDKRYKLAICDPPYRMTKNGKSCRENYMPKGNDNLFNGDIPNAVDWMSSVYSVLDDSAHMYVFCNTNELSNYLIAAGKCGFKLHNVLSMIKDTHMPNRWYMKYTELILFFRKGPAYAINDKTSRDYFMVNMPTQNTGKIHKTQKPLDLISTLVSNSTEPGDFVLDPFAGSATVGVGCINLGRNYTGFELDEHYYLLAKDRLITLQGEN